MLGPRAPVAIVAAFALYVAVVRCHGTSTSFLLLGDQIRDWTIALGAWHDLPLTGAPSVAGGRGLGPIYYWVLWIGRHLLGPFTGNLPHAGGLTLALLQAAADTALFVAVWRRVPLALALAIGLVTSTSPFDVGVSATIWNPQLAAALGKFSMALALGLPAAPSLWRVAGVATVAWLAVQAHGTGIFIGAPVLALLIGRPLLDRQWRRGVDALRVVAEVIVVLQVPFVVAYLHAPGGEVGPTLLIDSLGRAADIPRAFERVASLTGWLITHGPDTWVYTAVTLAALGAVSWRWRRDPAVLAITLGPIVAATALFAGWTRPYDSYWFLPAIPAVVLSVGLALASPTRDRMTKRVGVAALVLALAWQPARIKAASTYFRFPHYGALVDGSRAALRRAPALHDLRVTFPVEPSTNVTFLYRILGGRLDPAAAFDATIRPDGTVSFEAAR